MCKGGGNSLKYLKRGWNRAKFLKRGGKLGQGEAALKWGGLESPYELCPKTFLMFYVGTYKTVIRMLKYLICNEHIKTMTL